MSPEEKKLDKLAQLFEMVNEEYATPDDLVMLSETILSIITAEKERLDGVIANEKEEDKQEKAEMLALLSEKEQALKQIITRLTYQTEQSISQVDTKLSKTLSTEIKRLERKIPTKTDLSGLEREIADIKDSFNSFPTELTVNNEAVRDGLELLQGDERLDKSAIKGLDDWEEIVALARSPKTIQGAGVKLLRYLSDVNIEGITNGQTIIWNSSLNRFEPGSGGSGGGHTIQDEGLNLTQRTKLNFVGAGVTVTDGGAGPDSTIVTITSGGGTGDVVGPASAVADHVATFNGTTGKLIKDSGLTISGSNTGDQTSIVGITGTKAQFNTAVTDGDILYVGDVTQYTDENAQDAVGAMVATSIVYNDAGATLQRAALTGAITAAQDSNATSLGSFTKAQLDTAVSDGDILYVGDVTTNATHTGEVTGSGALTVDKTAITNKTTVTAVGTDYVLISDTSDSGNLKKALASDFTGGGGGSPGGSDTQIQFNDAGAFGGDADFTWDKTINQLTIGAENAFSYIKAPDATTALTVGGKLVIFSGTGNGNTGGLLQMAAGNAASAQDGNGGDMYLAGGDGGLNGDGGTLFINGGVGGGVSGAGGSFQLSGGDSPVLGDGGSFDLSGGNATNGNGGWTTFQSGAGNGTGNAAGSISFNSNSGYSNASGGDIVFQAGAGNGTGIDGVIKFFRHAGDFAAILNPENVNTSDKTFTFPNQSGTLALLSDITGGTGIVRTVVVTSGSATVGSTAATDYVYFIAGAHTMSLPAAGSNTNRYTFKNNHSAAVTVDTVGTETIDGTASISINPQNSVDIISDGTNYYII